MIDRIFDETSRDLNKLREGARFRVERLKHIGRQVLWAITTGTILVSLASCLCVPQKGKVDGESCSYQVLTALDAVVGAVSRVSRTELRKCGDAAKGLQVDAQALKASDVPGYQAKLRESIAKSDDCVNKEKIIEKVVTGAEDSTQAVADGIPAVAAAVNKDWLALLQPAFAVIKDLVKTVKDQGVAIPAQVNAILAGIGLGVQ